MSALDAISKDVIKEIVEEMKAAADAGERWFTIKPHDNVRRVMVALDEWVDKWEKPNG